MKKTFIAVVCAVSAFASSAEDMTEEQRRFTRLIALYPHDRDLFGREPTGGHATGQSLSVLLHALQQPTAQPHYTH